MKLQVLGVHPFDRAAPMNRGVIADELIGARVGVTLQRVTYQDPESGTVYIYLINLPVSVPPSLVALLYRSRWDVEKVFNEFKNKLGETKSWASTPNAKTCQARLLCLTHNLMTLMKEQIFRQTGIRNEAEIQRKTKTLDKRDECSKGKGRSGLTVLQQGTQQLTQRTVKFIR